MIGNLCDMESLKPFFAVKDGEESIVIHCASMVTTNAEFSQKLIDVNVCGSFNLCDVRDLAHGCIAAADRGRTGECYILGNKEVTLKEVCRMLHDTCGCKTPLFYVPIGMAYKLAARMEKKAAKTGKNEGRYPSREGVLTSWQQSPWRSFLAAVT